MAVAADPDPSGTLERKTAARRVHEVVRVGENPAINLRHAALNVDTLCAGAKASLNRTMPRGPAMTCPSGSSSPPVSTKTSLKPSLLPRHVDVAADSHGSVNGRGAWMVSFPGPLPTETLPVTFQVVLLTTSAALFSSPIVKFSATFHVVMRVGVLREGS